MQARDGPPTKTSVTLDASEQEGIRLALSSRANAPKPDDQVRLVKMLVRLKPAASTAQEQVAILGGDKSQLMDPLAFFSTLRKLSP